MHEPGPEARPPALWPCLALSALLALVVSFGAGFHALSNSDSLVPVMVSLCRWTPFYWSGNRVGMLLPALALPFQNPLHNLLAQAAMTVAAAFALLFLLARYVWPRPGWPLAGCAGAALLLLVPAPQRLYGLTFQQMHYPVALALGLGALLLLVHRDDRRPTRWHVAAAFVVMALALWVNIGTAVLLGPLLVARAALGGPRRLTHRETLVAGAVLVAGFAFADLLRRTHPMADDPVRAGLAGMHTWPRGWGKVAAGMWWSEVRPNGSRYLALALTTAVALLLAAVSRRGREPLRAAGAVVAAALAFTAVTAATRWVQGSHDWRYWFPAYYLVLGAAGLAAAGPLAELLRPRPRAALAAAAMPGLLLLALWQYGFPSPSRARADLDHMWAGVAAPLSADVVAADCTHLAGEYWTVLAAAFHANLRLYERGERRKVWPVTAVSRESWDEWGRVPPERMRVAVPVVKGKPDPDAQTWLGNLAPVALSEMTVVEKRPACWVFRPTDQVALERPPSETQPLLVSWHSGFYQGDGEPGQQTRWCQRRGELTLTNPAAQPRSVTLRLTLRTDEWRPCALLRMLASRRAGPARVWVQVEEEQEACEVGPDGTGCERKVTVPARGSRTLVFTTDAGRAWLRNGRWRRAYFQVGGVEIIEAAR